MNDKRGFHMTNQEMSVEDLKKKLQHGHCFVALEGEKVVGTCSTILKTGRGWWARGKKIAYNCLDAVLPEYQGTDIFIDLRSIRSKFIKDSGVEIIQLNTAEQNKVIQKMALKRGAKYVRYSATGKGADYYSVIMAEWLNGCPFNDKFVSFMYNLSKIIIKTFWKPGYKFRFWFN
ncbi:MAG: hypothetical protein J6P46_01475 [Bacteroidales bacterium]|nr:hypothetical protein [Bacteroidales bacterium]